MKHTRKTMLTIVGTAATATAILGAGRFGPVLADDAAPAASPSMSPSSTASPACTTSVGDPANVSDPGIGALTVTIVACDGSVTSASSVLSTSNYGRNKSALAAMDKLVPQYATTKISMVAYSGATYTAEAYRASLKSALTKAGLVKADASASASASASTVSA